MATKTSALGSSYTLPKTISYPLYQLTKPNEQDQFDLLYVLQTVFEENTYKHVLTDVDVASRYKVARSLRTTKSGKVVIVMGAIYKKSGVFKYQKVFQCDNGFKFKSDWRRFFEKADAELRTETAKYTHTHAAFSNELAKQLHKSMGSKELQNLEKVSAI